MNTARFKKKLLERQLELEALIVDTKSNSNAVKLDQTSVGRLSRMDAIQGQAMAEEVRRRRDVELKRISSALQRIEEDEFGFCITCGDQIAEKRLELDPSISLCNKCAK